MMMNPEREVDLQLPVRHLHLQTHAQDLSARMARKSKPIPPPLNLTAMSGSTCAGSVALSDAPPLSLHSPLKDFALLATSPRSPLVQKNLPFRKRAHSYSSTQTSSECESPESPLVPCSPVAREPPGVAAANAFPAVSSSASSVTTAPPPTTPLMTPTATTTVTLTQLHASSLSHPTTAHGHAAAHQHAMPMPSPTALTAVSPLTSPSPFLRSPTTALASPTGITSQLQQQQQINRRFLNEPIKSLLPSPNTSASFFNNECDAVKSPSLSAFYRPAPDLLPLSSFIEKNNALKSPLQTPTRSVFLQNHVDATLFFTDVDKMKSPLNTPFSIQTPTPTQQNLFLMPEPVSVKTEPSEIGTVVTTQPIFKEEAESDKEPSPLMHELGMERHPSPAVAAHIATEVKCEPDSPQTPQEEENAQSQSPPPITTHHYLDAKVLESFSQRIQHNIKQQQHHQQQHPYAHHYLFHTAEATPATVISPSPADQYPSGIYAQTQAEQQKQLNGYHRTPQTYKKSSSSSSSSSSAAAATAGTKAVDESGHVQAKKPKREIDEERPRRPMNAFMLFAKHQRPLLIQQHPGKDNRAISVVLGAAWRELQPEERADYVRRAAQMASEHKRRHPDCWKRRRVRQTNSINTTTSTTNNNNATKHQPATVTSSAQTQVTTTTTAPSIS